MDPDVPLFVLSAGLDELIPPHHQATMYESAASKDKAINLLKDGYHMNIRETIGVDIDKYKEWLSRCHLRIDKTN